MHHLLFKKAHKSLRFQFEFTVHHLMKLPREGVILYASWVRGRKWAGETKKSFVKNNTAVMEEDFHMRCTLFLNSKDKFKKKYLTVAIHEGVQSPSKKNRVGEIHLNLAEFASQSADVSQTRTFTVKLWDSCDAQLKLTLKSKIIPKKRGSGHAGGLLSDDSITDQTTMTDATTIDEDDDDDDEEHDGGKRGSRDRHGRKRGAEKGQQSLDLQLPPPHLQSTTSTSSTSISSRRRGSIGTSGESGSLLSPQTKQTVNTKRLSLRRPDSDEDDNGEDEEEGTLYGRPQRGKSSSISSSTSSTSSADYVSRRTSLVERQFKNEARRSAGDSSSLRRTAMANSLSLDEPVHTGGESAVDTPAISIENALGGTVDAPQPAKEGKQRHMMNSRERRKQNMSLSMEDDQDSFLHAIATAEEKSPRGRRSSVENTKPKEGKLQTALNKLGKQEQELKQLYTKLAERDRDEAEQTLLETLLFKMEPCFHQGIPIPAPLIFKALQYWDCFHPGKKNFLHRTAQELERAVMTSKSDCDMLCYWLSNTLVFLNLMQKEFPVSLEDDNDDASGNGDNGRSKAVKSHVRHEDDSVLSGVKLTTIDMPKACSDSVNEDIGGIGSSLGIHSGDGTLKDSESEMRCFASSSLVEVDDFAFESPVTKFKSDIQLLSYKAFCMLAQLTYQQIASKLVPAFFLIADGSGTHFSISTVTNVLTKSLDTLKENYIHISIVQHFMAQVFYFINAHIFNAVIAPRSELCSMGKAINMKMALTNLELWADDNGELTVCAKNELSQLRQVSNVLIMNKSSMVDFNTRNEVCPDINLKQIRRLLQTYRPDEYDPDEVSQSVIRALPTEKEEEERLHKQKKSGTRLPRRSVVLAEDGIAIESRVIFKPTNRFISAELPQWRSVSMPPSLKSKQEFAFLAK